MSAPCSSGRVVTGGAQVEVDGKDGAGAMRYLGGGGDVDDVPSGIDRRFDPQERRLAGMDGGGNGLGSRRVEKIEADAALLLLAQEPGLHAVIHDVGSRHALAGLERVDQGGERRHAGREDERPGSALELGHQLFEMLDIGAAVARVDVAADELVVLVPGEGRRRLHGQENGARQRIDVVAALRHPRADVEPAIAAVRHAGRR